MQHFKVPSANSDYDESDTVILFPKKTYLVMSRATAPFGAHDFAGKLSANVMLPDEHHQKVAEFVEEVADHLHEDKEHLDKLLPEPLKKYVARPAFKDDGTLSLRIKTTGDAKYQSLLSRSNSASSVDEIPWADYEDKPLTGNWMFRMSFIWFRGKSGATDEKDNPSWGIGWSVIRCIVAKSKTAEGSKSEDVNKSSKRKPKKVAIESSADEEEEDEEEEDEESPPPYVEPVKVTRTRSQKPTPKKEVAPKRRSSKRVKA